MSDDIVDRLSDEAFKAKHSGLLTARNVMYDAMYEIETSRHEIERLRAEVEVITKALRLACDDLTSFESDGRMSFDDHLGQIMSEYIDEARRD